MALPDGYFYKDGFYWALDSTGPYAWTGAVMQLVASGSSGSPHLGTLTAAAMLATPSPLTGWTCRVSDLGNTSPWFEFDGSNWLPLGRRQLIYRLTADESGVVMSTTLQAITPACAIPIGVLDFAGATLEWGLNVDKSAGVNAVTLAALFGSANNNTDAQITNPSTRTQQGIFTDGGFRRESATTVRVIGSGNAASITRFYDATNSARPAAVTVPNLGTTLQYLRMYGSQASGTDTITAHRWHVYLIG